MQYLSTHATINPTMCQLAVHPHDAVPIFHPTLFWNRS